MTLIELKANIGKEVLVTTGNSDIGYENKKGILRVIEEYIVTTVAGSFTNIKVSVNFGEFDEVTVLNTGVYSIKETEALDLRVKRLNTAVATIAAEKSRL